MAKCWLSGTCLNIMFTVIMLVRETLVLNLSNVFFKYNPKCPFFIEKYSIFNVLMPSEMSGRSYEKNSWNWFLDQNLLYAFNASKWTLQKQELNAVDICLLESSPPEVPINVLFVVCLSTVHFICWTINGKRRILV